MTDEKKYEGLCAGGPNDGKKLAADTKYVGIPIEVEAHPGIGVNFYTWRHDLQMWIWDHK